MTTSSPPIALALRSTRSERSQREPRRATGYRRGTTSTLWLKTSGRSAMHLRQRHLLAAEVGREHLDLAARAPGGGSGGSSPTQMPRAVVGQVVAVDARDDRVAQAHPRDRARDARGLERVVPRRLAGLDVAEAAAARARVAEDHERRGAALPALADVRARGLLADRVQVLVADQLRRARGTSGRRAAGTLNHGGLRARNGCTSVPSTCSTSIPPGLARPRVWCSRSVGGSSRRSH